MQEQIQMGVVEHRSENYGPEAGESSVTLGAYSQIGRTRKSEMCRLHGDLELRRTWKVHPCKPYRKSTAYQRVWEHYDDSTPPCRLSDEERSAFRDAKLELWSTSNVPKCAQNAPFLHQEIRQFLLLCLT